MNSQNLSGLKELSVLYADDDTLLRETTIKTLSLMCKKVYGASNGEEALKIINSDKNVHIVMLDIQMGVTSGFGGVDFGMNWGKEKSKEQSDSSNAKVSNTTAGEDLTKKATNKISDEGTQIKAGKDYTQTADTIENKAAQSTSSYSKKTETENIGFGVGVTTSATLKGGFNYDQGKQRESENSSTATVSNIQAGGNVNSKSTNKTTMEGTNISAGKDVNIEAKSLDVLQATDMKKTSESSEGFGIGVKAELGASGLKGAGVNFNIQNSNENSETSTAKTSNIGAGGNLNIKTSDNIKMQGTNLSSGKDTNIQAGGDVTIEAAKNIEKSSNTGFNVGVDLNVDMGNSKAKSSVGIGLDVGFNTGDSKSKEAVTGGIQSGGNINIKSGNNITLEGVDIDAAGKTKVDASGDVNLKAAESTKDGYQFGISLGLDATIGGGRKGDALPKTDNLTGTAKAKQSVSNAIEDKKDGVKSSGVSPVGFGLELGFEKSANYETTTINSKNGIEINSGGKVTQQQDIMDAATGGPLKGGNGGATINATGGIKTDTKIGYDIDMNINLNAGKDASKDGIKGK